MEEADYRSNNQDLRRIIEKLEKENIFLRNEYNILVDTFKEAVAKAPMPIVGFDKSGKLIFTNDYFISLLGFKGKDAAGDKLSLYKYNLKDLFEGEMLEYFKSYVEQGQTYKDKKIVINGFTYSFNLYSMKRGEYAAAIFNIISTQNDVNEEIMMGLNKIIETNFEMVQKIGSIMGEEVAKNTESLSNIIKILK